MMSQFEESFQAINVNISAGSYARNNKDPYSQAYADGLEAGAQHGVRVTLDILELHGHLENEEAGKVSIQNQWDDWYHTMLDEHVDVINGVPTE
jgi:hypothetical protein